jgi:hypothetical protein
MLTRELLLESRGYKVLSVFGDEAAKQVLSRDTKFDLFVVGHAAPDERRQRVARWLKATFPAVKLLSLNPPNHGRVAVADYNVPLNGPDEWLKAVASAIG